LIEKFHDYVIFATMDMTIHVEAPAQFWLTSLPVVIQYNAVDGMDSMVSYKVGGNKKR
jgi:cobalamin biosynthesis protein CobD/CbiB